MNEMKTTLNEMKTSLKEINTSLNEVKTTLAETKTSDTILQPYWKINCLEYGQHYVSGFDIITHVKSQLHETSK